MVYYIMYQGQVTGPMTREQMAAYNVTADTQVSANGGDWRPLYTYPELMEIVSQGPAPGSYVAQRQVSFGEAIKRGFSHYATFTGRASRSEYWWWMLFCYILSVAIMLIFPVNFADFDPSDVASVSRLYSSPAYIVSYLVGLALFLPNLSVSIRRLHDTGRSGWWVLLSLICCVGPIVLLVWYCQPSQDSTNEYGPVPNAE